MPSVKKLSAAKQAEAIRRLQQGESREAIAKSLGVAVSTLYATLGPLEAVKNASEGATARVAAPLAKTRPRSPDAAGMATQEHGRLVEVLGDIGPTMSVGQADAVGATLAPMWDGMGELLFTALRDEPSALQKVLRALQKG